MSENIWDSKLDYLKTSRRCFFNLDYLKHLIDNVWRIVRNVDIVDFGCGNGELGMSLLPLLPEGSIYTGLDSSTVLLDSARKAFSERPYAHQFKQADITTYEPKSKYDMAVCRTVLQHIPDALNVMERMKQSVKPGGLVICIETDRNLDNAGLYFDGLDLHSFNNLGILQKLWYTQHMHGGSDHTIGTKLPAYLQKIGLKNIGVRMSDYVQFLNPDDEPTKHSLDVAAFHAAWDTTARDEKSAVKNLISRGLSEEEAGIQLKCETAVQKYIRDNAETRCILHPTFLIIAYGTV